MTIGLAEITIDFIGLERAEVEMNDAYEHLVQDLDFMAQQGAEAAIDEMQQNHPYEDQTYQLSGGMYVTDGDRSRTRCTKYVDFLAPYAGFVNDGTSHSRAYPFVPQGVVAGQRKLDACAEQVLDRFCTKFGG